MSFGFLGLRSVRSLRRGPFTIFILLLTSSLFESGKKSPHTPHGDEDHDEFCIAACGFAG